MSDIYNKALELYKKDLDKIAAREEQKVNNAREKEINKIKSLLEEYPTERDVMDMFGYGCITEAKKNKLMELHNNLNGSSSKTVNERYLELIKKDLKSIKIELQYPEPEINEPGNSELEELKRQIETLKNKNEELERDLRRTKENNLAMTHQVDQFCDISLKTKKENKQLELKIRDLQEKSVTKKHNERGAGRKSRFTDQEREMIKMYRIQGQTIKEIAASFNCSAGLIHKLINE